MCQHYFERGKNFYCGLFSHSHLNYWCANRNEMLIAGLKCCFKLVTKHNLNPVSSCALSKWLNLSVVFSPACMKGGMNLPEAAQVLWTVPSWCCLYEQQHTVRPEGSVASLGWRYQGYWILQWKLLNKFWFFFFFFLLKQFFSYQWKYDLKLSNQ